MSLHVVGVAANGRVFHTTRNIYLLAPWEPWEDVTSHVGDPGSPLTLIDCATVGGELHVCGITQDERLLHTRRDKGGIWQPFWGDVGGAAGLANNEFTRVGVAGLNGELHVCATARVRPSSGSTTSSLNWFIHHAIRSTNPPEGWSQQFTFVDGGIQASENVFSDLACANVDGLLHVCALGSTNELWHTIRQSASPGDWQSFHDVKKTQSNDPGYIRSIGVAGIGNRLHACTQVNGKLFHTLRAPHRWQDSFGDVTAVMGGAFGGALTNIACANVEDNLHICCVTSSGQIVHTIRVSNPASWQNPEGSGQAVFGDVTAAVGALGENPGAFNLVSVA